MFTHTRHQALLGLLARRQRLSNANLLQALRCSPATLRRDLTDLEADGRLVRFHGGAAHPLSLRAETTLEQRSREARAEKRTMAKAAAALVAPRQTVFLDAGTSCLEVGRLLMSRRDLVLVTGSVAFAHEARAAEARVLCLGGELRGVSGALVGSLALSWLDNLRADIAFLGASGLDEDGASTTELSECEVKQALIRRARKRVLVADARKWDRPAAVRFARWRDLETWVTSAAVPAKVARRIGGLGPRVIVTRGAAT
jgi:DeoR/GlpR family transcriptional regulator of sugar metabolism